MARVLPLLRRASAAADLLFPPQCACCRSLIAEDAADKVLCAACRRLLVDEESNPCPRCAAPAPPTGQTDGRCPRCRKERFAFTGVTALGVYQGLLQEAVLRMKQPYEEALTAALGRLLAERLAQRAGPPPDLAAPVPMHWTRRLARGVNPAELLAETVARRLQVPCCPDLLRLRRRPRRQHSLLATERRRNMRGALTVRKSYDIRDARVLVVDDAMTTGATAQAAATVLKRAGAAETTVAVAARGIGV